MKSTLLLLAGILLSNYAFSGGNPEFFENLNSESNYQSTPDTQVNNLDYSIYDPWEKFNRKIFAFNDAIDTYAVKPLAKGYQFVTPDPLEEGFSRVFSNLGELVNIANDLLQGKFKQATNDTGRFLINSTVGLGGFFDVADNLGLE